MKKSQVVYFIVGGIVVTFIFLSILLYSNYIKKNTYEEELMRSSRIEESLIPIDYSLKECYYQLTSEMIKELGETGGKIDENRLRQFLVTIDYGKKYDDQKINNLINFLKHNNAEFVVGISFDPKTAKGDYINFFEISKIPIHYKYDLKKGLKYEYVQIENVLKNVKLLSEALLPLCVNKVSKIYPNYDIVPVSDPNVTIFPKDKELLFLINYRLEIQEVVVKNAKKKNLDKFSITLDVPLREMINITNQYIDYLVYDYELSEKFMEYFSVFKGLSSDMFPPNYRISEKFIIWNKNKLEEQFKDIAITFSSKIKVTNTKNYPYLKKEKWDIQIRSEYIPYFVSLYNFGIEPYFKIYPYPESPIYYPERMNSGNSFFGLNLMNTPRYLYSVSYYYGIPLIFEIYDDKSFKNEGFSFKIGSVISVCGDSFCYKDIGEKIEDETIDVNKALCELGDMTLSFKLKIYPEEVLKSNQVQVRFSCGGLECNYNLEKNNDNKYTLRIPQCLNGTLEISYGPNYLPYLNDSFSAIYDVMTDKSKVDLGEVKLYYYRSIYLSDISLLRIKSNKLKVNMDNENLIKCSDKKVDQTYAITLTHKDYPQFGIVLTNLNNEENLIDEFNLVPGTYELNIMYLKKGKSYILGTATNYKNISSLSSPLAKPIVNLLRDLYKNKDFETIDDYIESIKYDWIAPFSFWFNNSESVFKGAASNFTSSCGIGVGGFVGIGGGLNVPQEVLNKLKSNETIVNETKKILYELIYSSLEFNDTNFLEGFFEMGRNPLANLAFGCESFWVSKKDALQGIVIDNLPIFIYKDEITFSEEDIYGDPSNKLYFFVVEKNPMKTIFDGFNFELDPKYNEILRPKFLNDEYESLINTDCE